MMDPPVSYLESTVPAAACEMAIVFRSVGYAYFACRPIDLNTVSLLRYFPPPHHRYGKNEGNKHLTLVWSGLPTHPFAETLDLPLVTYMPRTPLQLSFQTHD